MSLQQFFMGLLYTLITVAGVAIVGQIMIFINKKIDEIQTSTKLSNYVQLNKYIDTVQEAITKAVKAVAQTYVDDLKSAGTFDDAAKAKAKSDAIILAKSLITTNGVEAIKTLYGDFEIYLDSAIEAVVKASK